MRALTASPPALALLGLALMGCADPQPLSGPEAATVRLFELVATDDPKDEQLVALFFVERLEDERAELLDALDGVADDGRIVKTAIEPLSGPDEVVADIEIELPGGGGAGYSVQLRRTEAGDWRISWFDGPGVEWPVARRGDSGLTVSAPATGYNQGP